MLLKTVLVTPWLVLFDKILAVGKEIFPYVTCSLNTAALSCCTGKLGLVRLCALSSLYGMQRSEWWKCWEIYKIGSDLLFFFLSSHFSPAKKKYPAWKRFRFLTLSIKNSTKVFLFILDFTRRRSWGRFVFLLLNNVFSLLTPW